MLSELIDRRSASSRANDESLVNKSYSPMGQLWQKGRTQILHRYHHHQDYEKPAQTTRAQSNEVRTEWMFCYNAFGVAGARLPGTAKEMRTVAQFLLVWSCRVQLFHEDVVLRRQQSAIVSRVVEADSRKVRAHARLPHFECVGRRACRNCFCVLPGARRWEVFEVVSAAVECGARHTNAITATLYVSGHAAVAKNRHRLANEMRRALPAKCTRDGGDWLPKSPNMEIGGETGGE